MSTLPISANVSATNAVDEIDQGRIGNVSALGALSGSLNAAYSIGSVTSGDAISATLSAPNLGSNLPFDTAILTSLLVPTIPASVRTDVLSDGATALAGILADKADFDASAQTFVADIAQENMSLQAGITQARTDLLADNATATAETQTELDADRQTALNELGSDRAAAATARQELETTAATRKTAAVNAWTAAASENQAAFNASLQDSIQAQEDAAATLQEAADDKATTAANALEHMQQDQNWSSQTLQVIGTAANPGNWIPGMINHVQGVHADLVRLADDNNIQGVDRWYMTVGGTAADLVGLRSLEGAWHGSDPYTLEKWSDGYRLFQAVTGALQLVETATGISMVASYFSTPCRSLRWQACFPAGHEVTIARTEGLVTSADTRVIYTEPDSSLSELAVVCFIVGIGGAIILRAEHRRSKPAASDVELDNLFQDRWFLDDEPAAEPVGGSDPSSLPLGRTRIEEDRPMEGTEHQLGSKLPHSKPIMPTRPSRDRNRRPTALAWLIAWLLLGGGFAWHSTATTVGSLETTAVAQQPTVPEVAPYYLTKPIEQIKVNDQVLAANPETGELSQRRVVQVFKRRSDHLRHLKFTQLLGSESQIDTTDEHPFWVVLENAWKPAKDLVPGDMVRGPDGQRYTLTDTHREEKPNGIDVYNFEVEVDHTYFIGSPRLQFHGGVLVHNSCYEIDEALENGSLHISRTVISKPQIHHIASQYDTRIRDLFSAAGLDIDSSYNRVRIIGHQGPHGWYNDYVFRRLDNVTQGLSGQEIRQVLIDELLELRWELRNTDLADLIRAASP